LLTEHDIAWMKANRAELVANRTSTIIVKYMDVTERDPFTNEPIEETEVSRTVQSVVTEISSTTGAGADRRLENGIEVEDGDIWLSVNIDDITDIVDKIERIEYDGKQYEILATDKKGIGEINRIEVLGRVIS
jgi:hypothetical protein